MTLIKICGIKTLDEALVAQNAGAWAVGEVFAPSPRQITPEEASRINLDSSLDIKRIGVFVDEPLLSLIDIIHDCRLDLVQLHGSETIEYAMEVPCPVIKTFRPRGPLCYEQINAWPVWALLFDTYYAAAYGGCGCTFNWDWLRGISSIGNVIIAGGLNNFNVSEVIRQIRPMAVDVSSGVEYPGGGKDPSKVGDFISAVRQADLQLGSGEPCPKGQNPAT